MDSQWLKAQFVVNPGRTKAGLATAIGLEPSAISKILSGGRQIKAQEYILMREYFGLPNDGEMKTQQAVAYKSLKQDGFDEESSSGSEWTPPSKIVTPSEKIKTFQVRDSLMEPEFKQGEQVLVDITDRKPSPPGVFLVSEGFSNMLRHCEFAGKSANEVKISAHKKGFQPQILKLEDFLIVGRVVAKLQML